jgi:hypothetical protein
LLDNHIDHGRRLREIANGRRTASVTLCQFGQRLNAGAVLGPNTLTVYGLPENNHPETNEEWSSNLDEAAAQASTDWGFTLSVKTIHKPHRESVAWLRVAYLYLFAAFGYRFAFRSELEPIRRQIHNPDERIVPNAITKTKGNDDKDGIKLVHAPDGLRSIAVALGSRMFWFPNFDRNQSLYKCMKELGEGSVASRVTGYHMDLPTKPVYGFDYDPCFMWYTVPKAERPQQFRD